MRGLRTQPNYIFTNLVRVVRPVLGVRLHGAAVARRARVDDGGAGDAAGELSVQHWRRGRRRRGRRRLRLPSLDRLHVETYMFVAVGT